MKIFSKPNVVVSKCIEFANCRYNGDIIHSQAVNDLKPFVNFIPVCPEVEIGLGIPRASIRIVEENGKRALVSSGTGVDYSEEMNRFAEKFLRGCSEEIDGFLMKTSSPSCGYRDTREYPAMGKVMSTRKNASGYFSEKIDEIFPNSCVETEGRLENFTIREEYYTKIFLMAEFREMSKKFRIKDLVEFHSNNKYLLMAYSSQFLTKLGNITANRAGDTPEEIFAKYKKELQIALSKKRKPGTNTSVMQHLMGYFSDKVTTEEKNYFMEKLELYRNSTAPASVPLSILESWVIRFQNEYLMPQTIFNPFPKELIKVNDSGKGRD